MGDLLYLRHSTDKQTNARQRHALADYLNAKAPAYEDPATSSRIHPLKRPGFRQLLDEASVGDVVRVADAARLFRSVRDVLDVRDVLRRRGVHLRVATGAWAGMDLTADDPMTKLFVTMLAGVLEFQRDMISENTKEGVAAARSAGKTLGRPTVLDQDQAAAVVDAFRSGTAVKALARQYGIAPKTVRRVLDLAGARAAADDVSQLLVSDDQADHAAVPEQADAGPVPVAVDLPGVVAEHLADVADVAVRQALDAGQTIRRGQGYSVRVTAPLAVHRAALAQCADLDTTAAPAGRKAYRIYAERVAAAGQN